MYRSLFILHLFFSTQLIGQKPKKAKENDPLPVAIVYSNSSSLLPDSIVSFISTCFLLKKITLIDSSNLAELSRSEMASVMKGYKEKGEPFPEFRELSSKFRTVGYFFHLYVFRNLSSLGAPLDSIKWMILPAPLNLEKRPLGMVFYPENYSPEYLYINLKKSVDEVLSLLVRKEQDAD